MTRHSKSPLRAAPFALAALLVACSHSKAPEPAATPQAQQTPPDKTVFDTQIKSLQKAKDVQKTVDQQAAAQDKQVEEQGK